MEPQVEADPPETPRHEKEQNSATPQPALPPDVSQPCAPATIAPLTVGALCVTSACGPFGGPFPDAPGPGTGIAVPPIPPAWLFNTPTGPVHDRYPYYSYRRPWYSAGPASANVTIVW
jgi:hypothetical protein